MADCFPPEADDLHRRWLPREIYADIGIVDAPTVADASAVGVEELAAQLAGILGGGSKVCPLARPPPPPTPASSVTTAPRHGAKVCGLEGSVAVSCGGTNAAGGGGGAAVSWPFVPYPPANWQQGASNLVNLGGVLDYCYSAFPPAPPCSFPPPAKLRGGTGVFIPRAKGGVATRAWPGTGRPATGRKQEWQQNEKTATTTQKALQSCPRPELALPYR